MILADWVFPGSETSGAALTSSRQAARRALPGPAGLNSICQAPRQPAPTNFKLPAARFYRCTSSRRGSPSAKVAPAGLAAPQPWQMRLAAAQEGQY